MIYICCPPPLLPRFGSLLGYITCTTHASCIGFPTECFDGKATLHTVQQGKCAELSYAGMFTAELERLVGKEVEQKGFDHIRTGIVAGSSIPKEFMKRFHRELDLTVEYAIPKMTETSPVSAVTTTDDPLEK
ncbi:unnamed protein product [Tuber aestivum]|uniref:AMP-dependent synthetase/ligase domain-containing protein n=1 Tax=Tuber aestivum TaxID=59557 RepID=A0A292PJY3_9PEZI|nr:unnamed protein product [Tuber aestivum]